MSIVVLMLICKLQFMGWDSSGLPGLIRSLFSALRSPPIIYAQSCMVKCVVSMKIRIDLSVYIHFNKKKVSLLHMLDSH
jgi:hypothetical protein